jgi:AcrR family transcriptional regulator
MSVAERASTRDEIRRAAAGLFFAKGYEATSMRELAEALAIKSASIYYHFADKEQILYEIVRDTLELSRRGIADALAREQDPARRLAALVVHHVALNATRPREATLVETELRSLTGERRTGVLALRDVHDGLVLATLEHGSAAGAFGLVDAKLTTYALVSMCLNVGAWYREGGRLPLDEVAAVYASLALRLVGAAPLGADELRALAREAISFYSTI